MVIRTSPTGRLSLTLRAKYVLLVCAAVVLSIIAVSVPYFFWVERLTLAKATDALNSEAELVAAQVKGHIEQLRNDVLTVSRMPPLKEIVRSTRNGGAEPPDGVTEAQWREQVEIIFSSIVAARPDYAQMRYIGLADDGLELVRVDQSEDGSIRVTGEADLQPKASQPYFRDSLTLAPGEVYFSDITLNVDFGQTEADNPMLRAVTPVADSAGQTEGLLVINAHFGRVVREILQRIPPSRELYIVTEAGDYVRRSASGRVDDLVLAGAGHGLPPHLSRSIAADGDGVHGASTHVYDDGVVSTVRFAPEVARSVGIVVVLSQPRALLLKEVSEARRSAILLALGLIPVMALVAFLISRWLTAPLLRLATALRRGTPGNEAVNLPTDRPDEIGEVARALETLIDRRRRIEATQAATLARLQSILDNTVDAMVTVDTAGIIRSFNNGASKVFGYSPGEIIGRGIDTLMVDPAASGPGVRDDSGDNPGDNPGDDRRGGTRLLRGPDRKGVLRELREQDARTKDGRIIPVEFTVSAVQTDDGDILSCIIREISERKRLEAEISAHAEALERSNTELEEFAYIASHDLKEPLRAISNHTQFLAEDHGHKLDEDGHRRIARLKELCARADRLISQLLHFSRLGRDALKFEQVDLRALAEEIRADLAETLAANNAEVRIAPDLPTVRGDRSRLTSLIYNLVVNGLKYNDHEAPLVEIGVRQDGAEPAGRVALFVRDNGIGIAPEFHDTVFKIFKRLNSEKAYGPGTGVGLSFARRIVERHGGHLSFESAPGVGTTFFFDLQGSTP
ncbi:ATP-binding protein [Thalassobaculum salexigens]|uniref:ATP-binding protein n=1 Tax=Thalassobaculum salexigens TaxID=455360 RepID=UPI0003FBAB1B|nr:ATP-binding protein [Thalassobaculum salexigens]